jgi:hypothetical protein
MTGESVAVVYAWTQPKTLLTRIMRIGYKEGLSALGNSINSTAGRLAGVRLGCEPNKPGLAQKRLLN